MYDISGTGEPELLRTVKYTYYITGWVSNIAIKDEDPDPSPISGADPAYDVYQELALYYYQNGDLKLGLWGEYEMNAAGDRVVDYVGTHARQFEYDSPTQMNTVADYDVTWDNPNVPGDDREWTDQVQDWTLENPVRFTEYGSAGPYRDRAITRTFDAQNEPVYTPTDSTRYLGRVAHQTVDVAGDELAFRHGDLIGSTVMTTDENGAVTGYTQGGTAVSAVSYTAFGEVIAPTGAPGDEAPEDFTRHQYAGAYAYESDMLALEGVNTDLPPVTLQHLGHRWYQPDIGRFVQGDPIGIWGGLNVYAYVENNPLTWIDPSGLTKGGKQRKVPSDLPRNWDDLTFGERIKWLENKIAKAKSIKAKRAYGAWLKLTRRSVRMLLPLAPLLGLWDLYDGGMWLQRCIIEPAIEDAQEDFGNWINKKREKIRKDRGLP